MFEQLVDLKDAPVVLDDSARKWLGEYFKTKWLQAAAASPDVLLPAAAYGQKLLLQNMYEELVQLRKPKPSNIEY